MIAVLVCGAWPGSARAQLFSPGKLAKAHADLEGLDNCTKCHPKGGKLEAARCLDCHTELKDRVAQGKGYHGKLTEKACEKCHRDHKGLKFQMIRWDKKAFDHREAGWILEGAHRKAKCEGCHEVRLIKDAGVKKILARANKKETFLGVGTRCRDCHFDEHRGQLDLACDKCHDAEAFKPAKGFDHAKTDYALKGLHRKVACDKCHATEVDGRTPSGAFPAPVSREFARYSPVEHERCTDCHADPHDGRFGKRCEKCHSEVGWGVIQSKAKGNRAFHDKTRYPLEGEHEDVACEACHLPLGKTRQVFKGLPFDRCDRCHLDAHQGQVKGDCADCHDLNGFVPARYDEEAHARAALALEGAHRAVACQRCHEVSKRKEEPTKALAKALKKRKRAFEVSAMKLDLPGRRCLDCHKDPHGGQLDARVKAEGCEGCHDAEAWSRVRLDHATQTRYPLTGAHAEARCGDCHVAPKAGQPVRYRPLATECASCHPDVHAGQLGQDCQRCHDTSSFKLQAFLHEKTRFPLTGKHQETGCEKCHLTVEAAGAKVVRYQPLPLVCEGCHADYHQGGFDSFVGTRTATVTTTQGTCAACHATRGWAPAAFDHAQVGWALVARHAEARCGACHGTDLKTPLSRDCASCHRDPHRGELGQRCEGCHQELSWESRFDADAHQSTTFPLSGAHAMIPCEECHSDTFGRGFVRAAAGCVKCHAQDYDRAALTGIDHVQAGFDTDCRRCHTPWTFERGRFDQHDACFYISAGPHAGISCLGCHDSLQGAQISGQCNTGTARCTGCHEHTQERTDPEHREVSGYQYKDQKCYECHRFAER
ncbi:MAG: hypothetical protein H6730_02385 [Deltaproteobacteria bacterium]|nr:hypothetical protein [Deltaproteobacteria bacterium]